jgi:cyclopropane-fatty-acyl-phospholipid synthase
MLFRIAVRDLPVRVEFPDGRVLGAGGPDSPLMLLVRPESFFHRLGADAKIGFGEAYMVGDWTSPEAPALLTPFAERMATLIPQKLQTFRRFVDRHQPSAEENNLDGARANIRRHYDLPPELFGTFLDESMTYSSAMFADPAETLATAQHRKVARVLDQAGVRAGTHLLEIGTGWGSLAIQAARRGARVTTLTVSDEQRRLAAAKIAEAGVGDRVQVLARDYREAGGAYDAIISVEMVEAVGEKYWPAYFRTLDRLLKPGGKVGLQAITMPHDRMLATRNSYTWIHKYIFPGGLIPSVEAIEHTLAAHTSLRVAGAAEFGRDYAETLRRWRERFLARWAEISALGFDETFRRMWEFYLGYSEAGFRSGYLTVRQMSLSRSPSTAQHGRMIGIDHGRAT